MRDGDIINSVITSVYMHIYIRMHIPRIDLFVYNRHRYQQTKITAGARQTDKQFHARGMSHLLKGVWRILGETTRIVLHEESSSPSAADFCLRETPEGTEKVVSSDPREKPFQSQGSRRLKTFIHDESNEVQISTTYCLTMSIVCS